MKLNAFSPTGEKRRILRRIIVFTLVGFFMCIIQCSFFSRLKPFGATPDIVLGSVLAICMLDGKKSAAVYAVGAGYFIDAIGATPPSLSPIFYLLAVAVLGFISEKMMPRFLSFTALMLPTAALGALFTFIDLWITLGAFPPAVYFPSVILPEILSTFIFCLPVYFFIKLCMLPLDRKG